MEKFIPYEKLSKKEKRKIDQAKRQTWGELNPVTRKPESSKAYNRKKSQDWKRELPPNPVTFALLNHSSFEYGLKSINNFFSSVGSSHSRNRYSSSSS